MIAALLAALALQSSTDDCAVLEAVLPEPIEAAPVRVERPEADTIEWAGVGRAVVTQQEAPVYANWPGMGEDGVVSSGQHAEIMHWFEVVYPNLSLSERLEHARLKFQRIEPALAEAWGALPEGLSENFLLAVASLRDWDCDPDGWAYLPPAGTITDLLDTLPYGTGLSANGLTRPGYSADGQWALVYYSYRYQNSALDDALPPDPWDSGGMAYLLVRSTANGWIVHDRYDEIVFN